MKVAGLPSPPPLSQTNAKDPAMSIYTPYTYLIGWSNLGEYYYGVRYAQDCHPNDFWNEYYTSSAKVAEYREVYGEPDVIQIRKTFDNREAAIAWEAKVLRRMKVIKEDHWINQAAWPAVDRRGTTHSEETKRKISEAKQGTTHSEETKRKMSESLKGNTNGLGRTLSEETRQKISQATKGRVKSIEHQKNIWESRRKNGNDRYDNVTRQKMSQSKLGRKWWTNGIEDILSFECPNNWRKGRSKAKKRAAAKKMNKYKEEQLALG